MLFGTKNTGVEWLVVGLGNPGEKYAKTRHNMGFLTLDLLAEREKIRIDRLKFKAVTAQATFGGARCLLMKPQTFMNLSGEAVREAAQFYKIPPEKVLVIYDDISIPVGKIRVRPSGSAGGHNGIKNIIAHLGTDQFPRVKVGVGAPGQEGDMIDWVIGNPSQAERKILQDSFERAIGAAECIIREDGNCQKAMNLYN
jgi:PTH1 family peptidyl-tRNA hydrolase